MTTAKLTPEVIEAMKQIEEFNRQIAVLEAKRNNIEIECMRITGIYYPEFQYLYTEAQEKKLI